MSIYLYGLLETDDPYHATANLTGLNGVTGPTSIVQFSDLIILFSDHDDKEILPRRRLLLSHAKVLEQSMEFGTVLPMRFGMVSPTIQDFRDLLRAESAQINDALNRVRGRVELGVRLIAPEAASLTATLKSFPKLASERDSLRVSGPGAHFKRIEFGRRLGDAVAERRKASQKQALKALRTIAASDIVKAPDTDFDILRGEFLVEETAVVEFSETLAAIAESPEFCFPQQADAQIIGPGPAFHFVDITMNTTPSLQGG